MRDRVLIVGGGMMGCGIAAAAMSAGEKVTVVESNPEAKERVISRVHNVLNELSSNGLMDSSMLKNEYAYINVTDSLEEACQTAYFTIEAIVEDLSAKQEVFKQLDAILPPDVIIASNTSGLRITDIADKSVHKQRMVTTHFWFPAHLVPLVEVVMGDETDKETAEWAYKKLKTWGKAPVLVKKDLPGQLANRILQAVIREATAIVDMGLASPEDVDTAVKMGMGIRFPVWGPLEHVDAVGLDLCNKVQNTVLPSISRDTSANKAFTDRIARGELGYKSGKGFYDWSEKDMSELEQLRNDFIIQSVKFIKSKEKR